MVCLPCSLRVSVVAFVVIIVFFFAVAFIFLFVFFLVWLLAKEEVGSYRLIRRVRVEALCMYGAHAQWYPCCPFANAPYRASKLFERRAEVDPDGVQSSCFLLEPIASAHWQIMADRIA